MEQLELQLHENVEKVVKPNCWNCKNFAISWVKEKPYKCNSTGLLYTVLPSKQMECNNFISKPK